MEADAVPKIRAVQYLRMSTEHQRYSLASQRASIGAYAQRHGYHIVGTFTDHGRSGLTLSGRQGLKSLLSETLRPGREFDAILVLDVSRWGRFQDPDQGAYYEFLCKEAGARVIYCAESFENDGAITSSIVKHLKRVMAAEYSRELSDKVHWAQVRQARLGFKQGGIRPFGVRRVLLDRHGAIRTELRDGERKALRDEKVTFVRGPESEVRAVREIFRLYVDEWSLAAIARHLNEKNVPTPDGRPWRHARVRAILASELALGNYVFDRTSRRLSMPERPNPRDSWVRFQMMSPIVSKRTFERAAVRLAERPRFRTPRSTMLRALQRLLRSKGYLSTALIDACPHTPKAQSYRYRFGSLLAAYERVGYSTRPRCWGLPDHGPASNEELLGLLRKAFERHGYLTGEVINRDPQLPGKTALQARFGTLSEAYRLAGIPYSQADIRKLSYERAIARGTRGPGTPPTNPSRYTDEYLVAGLQRLHARNGYVCGKMINEDEELPTETVYAERFGSLHAAYVQAGVPYDASRRALRAAQTRRLRRQGDWWGPPR